MAFSRFNAVKVAFQFIDSTGSSPNQSEYSFYVGELAGQTPNINEAEWEAFLNELGDDLNAISDCWVPSATLSYRYINDASPVAFGNAPDVERKGVLLYNAVNGFSVKTSVPGMPYDAFDVNGVDIIRNPADPQDFTGNPHATELNRIADKMRDGVTINAATHPVTTPHEEDIVSLKAAYKQHIARNKG